MRTCQPPGQSRRWVHRACPSQVRHGEQVAGPISVRKPSPSWGGQAGLAPTLNPPLPGPSACWAVSIFGNPWRLCLIHRHLASEMENFTCQVSMETSRATEKIYAEWCAQAHIRCPMCLESPPRRAEPLSRPGPCTAKGFRPFPSQDPKQP